MKKKCKTWATETENLAIEYSLLFPCWAWPVGDWGALGIVHVSSTQSVVPGPVAATAPAPGNLIELQILGPTEDLWVRNLGGRPSNLYLNKQDILQGLLMHTQWSTSEVSKPVRPYQSPEELVKTFLGYTTISTKIRISGWEPVFRWSAWCGSHWSTSKEYSIWHGEQLIFKCHFSLLGN